MASFEPGKRIIGAGMDHDIITRLPDEIKEKILTKLPIKEAVKTSILSTKWRYTWETISEIVLDADELVPNVVASLAPVVMSRLARIVDLLLFLHKGPILKFHLSTKYLCTKALDLCTEALDRWLLYLSRSGITEVTFLPHLASDTRCEIPLNFFFCNALQNVHLSMCSIRLPSGFEGFKLLNTLELDDCSICAVDFEKLVSSSTQLVVLSLRELIIRGKVHIHAKKLKWLKIIDVISGLQIDAPQLTTLVISSRFRYWIPDEKPCSENNLCKTLGGLLKIKTLHLTGTSIRYLMGDAVAEFPRAFSCLNELALRADIISLAESNFVLLLLQSAISLKKLSFEVILSDAATTRSSFWEEKSNLGFALDHLREVTIATFEASEALLAFIKLVLGSASVLKRIIIVRSRKVKNPWVFKRLLKFQRASAESEVIFD